MHKGLIFRLLSSLSSLNCKAGELTLPLFIFLFYNNDLLFLVILGTQVLVILNIAKFETLI